MAEAKGGGGGRKEEEKGAELRRRRKKKEEEVTPVPSSKVPLIRLQLNKADTLTLVYNYMC